MRKIKLSHEEVEVKLFLEVIGVYMVLALLLVGAYYLEPAITSFVTVTKQINYTDDVNLEFDESGIYVWELANPGPLKSIKISGSKIEQGQAKVYLEDNGVRHLIFDSTNLVENPSGLFGITGFVVAEDEGENEDNDGENENEGNEDGEDEDEDEVPINDTINNETQINDTTSINDTVENETLEKIININLEYGDDNVYDANNDGVERLDGVIDIKVDGSNFNWDADEENLCTRYEVFSIENQESTFACFGNSNCCNFVDLESSRELWNNGLFLSYGSYGSTNDNIVFAQVLYVDYNLSSDEPYSEIAYSSWGNLTAKFLEDIVEFEDVCIDTCLFEGNATGYTLIIEIENTRLAPEYNSHFLLN